MKPGQRSERLYLTDVLEAVDRIAAYTREGREAFLADNKTQDAVVRNLEVIGEAVKNVSVQTREAHPEVPWPDIAAMRDRIIHGYFTVHLGIVWDVVENDLTPLGEKVAAILSGLEA